MYARVTILDDVDPHLREETRNSVETEGQRLERELPGYQDVLTLVDGENRRTTRIHLFDCAEALGARFTASSPASTPSPRSPTSKTGSHPETRTG